MTPEERELLIDTADCFLRYVVDDRLLKLHTESLRESLQKVMSDRAYRITPMTVPAPETTREVLERLRLRVTQTHEHNYGEGYTGTLTLEDVERIFDEELEKL